LHIQLAPTLPAFLSPNIVNIPVDKFGISGSTEPDADLKKFGLLEEIAG
jgi:hydroxylamine reductase